METGAGADDVEHDDAWGPGGLSAALRRAAEQLGVEWPAPARDSGRIAEYGADGGARRVTVYPPDEAWQQPFQVNLQQGGPRLAGGCTDDLDEVVRATVAWIAGVGLEETRERAPFIGFRPWALAHEREPLGRVELTWRLKLDRVHLPPYDRFPEAHALVAAAYAQSALRQLMPVNSHFDLWFSHRIEDGWRYPVGHVIAPDPEDGYAVYDNHELVARTATAEEAAALVAAALPEGLGPAT
ncbi:DUF6193 family natural product biosynthesis protein [Kitasatospora sp. NPDC096147]|uniref:DUF6193 family natural product biosynthesis protein n=1 Tax=Kitasatospora sp. NPDC096147 TaxID=3364093 RepID=UPI00381052FE